MHLLQTFDSPKSQTNRWLIFSPPLFSLVSSCLRGSIAFFQRAIPFTTIHIHRAHFHTMLARIADDLRRRVKAHRLTVQQRRAENRGVITFDPRRRVHQNRKRSSVAFGESVFAEA